MRNTIFFKLYSKKLYLIFIASKDDSLLENHNISFNKIFLYLKFSTNNFVAMVSSNFLACQLS